MSEEIIKNTSTPDNSFVPKWVFAYPLSKEKNLMKIVQNKIVCLFFKNMY